MSKVHLDLNGRTILVTGSPGFIGANLVMRLLREMKSGTVISFDNMNDYLYADGPSVVSVSLRATKSYHSGRLEIPVFMEGFVNPYTRKAGIVAGVTLRPFK